MSSVLDLLINEVANILGITPAEVRSKFTPAELSDLLNSSLCEPLGDTNILFDTTETPCDDLAVPNLLPPIDAGGIDIPTGDSQHGVQKCIDNVEETNKIIEKQIDTHKQTLIDLLKSNYNRAVDKRLTLIKKLAEYELKVYGNTSALDLDFLKIKRLYTINEEFYNKLLEKKAEYLISQAGSISENTILEKSVVPSAPISPIRNSVFVLFMVVALVLNASIIILRYLLYNQNKIK